MIADAGWTFAAIFAVLALLALVWIAARLWVDRDGR